MESRNQRCYLYLVHSSTEPAVFLQMPLLLNLFYLTLHVLQTRIIFNTTNELVLFSRTLLFSQTKLDSSVSVVLCVHPHIYVSSDKLEPPYLPSSWAVCVFTTHVSFDILCYVLNCPLMCFILPTILNSYPEIGQYIVQLCVFTLCCVYLICTIIKGYLMLSLHQI